MEPLETHIFLTLLFSTLGLLAVLILLIYAQKLYRHFKPKSLEQIYLEEIQKLRFKWSNSLLIKHLVQKRIKREISKGEHKSLMKKLRDDEFVEELKSTPRKENFFITILEYRLTEKGKRYCSRNLIHLFFKKNF